MLQLIPVQYLYGDKCPTTMRGLFLYFSFLYTNKNVSVSIEEKIEHDADSFLILYFAVYYFNSRLAVLFRHLSWDFLPGTPTIFMAIFSFS